MKPASCPATSISLILLLALIAGCGGGNGTPAPNTTSTPGANIGSPTPPTSVSLIPVTTPQFLYVANRDARTIFGFVIDRNNGALTPVPGSPVGAPFRPIVMKSVDRFLLVGDADATQVGSFAEYRIDTNTGALTLVSSSSSFAATFQPGPFVVGSTEQLNISNSVVDSAGRVYVSGFRPGQKPPPGSTDAIGLLTVDSAGNVVEAANSPFFFPVNGVPASPGPLALDPGGRFLYAVLRACFNAPCTNVNAPFNALAAIDRQSDGSLLTFASGSPLKIADFFLTSHDRCITPSSLAIHPSGTFLYLDCPGDDIMTTLTGGSRPGRTATGRVFGIQAYRVDGGIFTLLETFDCCETQGVLNGVKMVPKGQFLLALTEGISVFAINQSTGFITEVAGSPFAPTSGAFSAQFFPRAFATDTTGRFIYAVRGSDLTVLAFSLDANTGALTQLTSPVTSLGAGTVFSMQVAQPAVPVTTAQ
jgi:6-phosphogluconolactonase